MASYDRAMADRVWKRVQGERQEPPSGQRELDLRELIQNEWMAAAAYLQLARQLGAREAAVLQRLAREEQAHGVCLKGMYRMMNGEVPAVKTPRPQRESVETALRKAYAGELKSIAAYDARSDHPEYGQVFADMAKQEREHSRAVLELLGRLGRETG